MYPNLIVDNFFEQPDKIIDCSLNLEYGVSDDGSWPGVRSNFLHLVNQRLFEYISKKITYIFYDSYPTYNYSINFQKVNPFSDNQYDKKNCGWVHSDESNFGGVIFLTKNPDEDTGLNIFNLKNGFYSITDEETKIKRKHFLGGYVDDTTYNEVYDSYHKQFEETVKIKNVFNRLVLFNRNTYHAVQTFGTKERLTISFFNYGVRNKIPPLYR